MQFCWTNCSTRQLRVPYIVPLYLQGSHVSKFIEYLGHPSASQNTLAELKAAFKLRKGQGTEEKCHRANKAFKVQSISNKAGAF